MNFQPISFWIKRQEMTFEPISVADTTTRNLIWQAWFRFLHFVSWLSSVVSIARNICASTYYTDLTSVRQN